MSTLWGTSILQEGIDKIMGQGSDPCPSNYCADEGRYIAYMLEYIRNELLNLSDNGNYATFTSALIPGCDNLIGVRQPVLKKYARRLVKDNEDFRALLTEPDIYHEETLLRGYVIGYGTAKEKNFDMSLQDLKDYVPLVSNWAVNDGFCAEFKVMDSFRDEFLPYIRECVLSGEEYKARVGLIMLLDHYLKVDENGNKKARMRNVCVGDIITGNEKNIADVLHRDNTKNTALSEGNDYKVDNNAATGKYLDEIFSLVNRDFSGNGYYTQMAAGWLLAECFVTFPRRTWEYLTDKNNLKLDAVSYKKAINKICESLTPDKGVKALARKIWNHI